MLTHGHPEVANAKYLVFADSQLRYTDCSGGVCELLGYSREELLEKTIEDVSFNEKEVSSAFSQFLRRGGMEGGYVLRHKHGMPIPINYHAFVFSDGCKAAVWEPIKDWREPYLAALIETDPVKLKRRIDVALVAVQKQIYESRYGREENQELRDATSALQLLLRNAK